MKVGVKIFPMIMKFDYSENIFILFINDKACNYLSINRNDQKYLTNPNYFLTANICIMTHKL